MRHAARYRDRGVVGVGLGGLEAQYPPEPYRPAFELAHAEGLASVPHAGEVVGPRSVRGALDALGADRIRHGIRAVEDPGLVRELAGRGTVLDVCPISNLRTKAVGSLDEHPLPRLAAAGVRCSISTDDPAMFGTDLTRDYEAATSLGVDPRAIYDAGLAGALCGPETKAPEQALGQPIDRRVDLYAAGIVAWELFSGKRFVDPAPPLEGHAPWKTRCSSRSSARTRSGCSCCSPSSSPAASSS